MDFIIRSNYFKVTSSERLIQLVEASGCMLWNKDDQFAFGGNSDYFCNINTVYLDENEDAAEGEVEFDEELQAILAPGEVCIIQENSSEKLRFVDSHATIISEEDIVTIDFKDIIMLEVKRANPNVKIYNKDMTY